MLKIKEAHEELKKKSYRDIQEDTAWKWASRSAATYESLLSAPVENLIAVWTIAQEYYHEAIEHAALVEDGGPSLLKKIQEAVEPYQEKAFEDLEVKFGQESVK